MSRLRNKWIPWGLLITLAFALILSCASQDSSGESDEESTTADNSEKPNANATVDDLADLTDGSKDDATKTASADKSSAKDDLSELENLESSPSKASTASTAAATPDTKKNTGDSPLDESILGGQTAASTSATSSKSPVEATPGPATPATETAPVAPVAAIVPLPKIPATAVSKKGVSLNRFYFLRKGDTPEKTSHLLYGSNDQAKDLKKWNPGTWKPGKIVYYASPTQPQDPEMRSFYQERSVAPQEYEVKKGENLARIAQKQLGDRGSWKEIAIINGLTENSVEPGQRLAVYPADLSSYSMSGAAVAKNAPVEAPAPAAPAPAQPEAAAAAHPEPAPAPEAKQPVAENPVTPAPKGLNVRRLIEQNMPAAVLLAGVLTLVLILMMVNKRRKAKANDELADESFSPPKARQK